MNPMKPRRRVGPVCSVRRNASAPCQTPTDCEHSLLCLCFSWQDKGINGNNAAVSSMPVATKKETEQMEVEKQGEPDSSSHANPTGELYQSSSSAWNNSLNLLKNRMLHIQSCMHSELFFGCSCPSRCAKPSQGAPEATAGSRQHRICVSSPFPCGRNHAHESVPSRDCLACRH